jgi:hypothetical protein
MSEKSSLLDLILVEFGVGCGRKSVLLNLSPLQLEEANVIICTVALLRGLSE